MLSGQCCQYMAKPSILSIFLATAASSTCDAGIGRHWPSTEYSDSLSRVRVMQRERMRGGERERE